jgi:hypothetical protein
LPWRSGGASAVLIALMSGFDDSASDSDLEALGSSAESSGGDSSDGISSSSSDDNTNNPSRRRRAQGTMVVRPDGSPDPSALTDQDYRDIPGPSQ